MTMSATQAQQIADLRARVASIATIGAEGATLPFGVSEVDRKLAGGGLARSGLHEITSFAPRLADEAAATLFVAGLAARFAGGSTSVLWAVTRFDLYAPGLEQVGLGPASLLFVEAREEAHVLGAMEDALRDGSVAVVVGEVKRADMTATRRLQLASAETSTPALLFRRWRRAGACPLLENSAATTRWRIGCAPSEPLGYAGVGRARWTVELARQRNGDPFSLLLEGCDAEGRLALPAAVADRATAQSRAATRAA